MFSPYHNSGFNYAPVAKGLVGGLVLSSIAFNVPLSAYRHWFTYTYSTVFEQFDIVRFLSCRFVFLDPKDIICAAMMLYHFRIFERRYGSLKFASYLFGTFVLSSILELSAVSLCHKFDLNLDPLPSGPYGVVFALFVPYFCDIPRVAVTQLGGIPVTGKSLTYIIGLQMASGSLEAALLALCGVISGLVYKHNVANIQSILKLPEFVGTLFKNTLGRLMDTTPPLGQDLPMGATIEIQRQQHIERLEQQMMWGQLQNHRPQARNAVPGMGLFGNRNGNVQHMANNMANTTPPPSEDQVQQLVEMGFQRERVLQALRETSNDLTSATSVLLREA